MHTISAAKKSKHAAKINAKPPLRRVLGQEVPAGLRAWLFFVFPAFALLSNLAEPSVVR
eukprot:SAG31_NODE_649_length_13201_cov_12.359258_4_plen_59_part_00